MIAYTLKLSMLILLSFPVFASEIQAFARSGKIGIVVDKLSFPESFSKDMASGLTNKILIGVEAIVEDKAAVQTAAVVLIKYDLWNENYKLTFIVGESTTKKTFKAVKEVSAFLSHLRVPDLIMIKDLPKEKGFILKISVFLNPIEKERMDKIRSWVAQNSASIPDPSGLGSVKPIAHRSSSLFNKIFDQYAADSDLASAWREVAISKPLRLADVVHEKE